MDDDIDALSPAADGSYTETSPDAPADCAEEAVRAVYFTDDEGNPRLSEGDGEGENELDTTDDENVGVDWARLGRSLINGEILRNRIVSGQVMFLIVVVILALLYTANRYSSQQEIILIDSLKVVVQQEQYNVLTQSSELLNLMRQSNIEQALRQHGDTTLLNPVTPPFEIIPEEKP